MQLSTSCPSLGGAFGDAPVFELPMPPPNSLGHQAGLGLDNFLGLVLASVNRYLLMAAGEKPNNAIEHRR